MEENLYVCPQCKCRLRLDESAFHCSACNRTYPIVGNIPDFLAQSSLAPATSRIAKVMDFMAPIYESRLFVSALLKTSGVRDGPKFVEHIASFHTTTLKGIAGTILDVACGPATYTRRMASPSRDVYGIDVSMGVLRQGMRYIARDGVDNVHLAHASVEQLPFGNAVFDGGVCSGSLHLFPDVVLALREIARSLKPGAPLSVQTFISGNTPFNRFMQNRSWLHTFELVRLQQYLREAGFEQFQPEVDGIVLTFSARKATESVRQAG